MSKTTAPPAQIFELGAEDISAQRKNAGRALIAAATFLLLGLTLIQSLLSAGIISFGFENWRATNRMSFRTPLPRSSLPKLSTDVSGVQRR